MLKDRSTAKSLTTKRHQDNKLNRIQASCYFVPWCLVAEEGFQQPGFLITFILALLNQLPA